MLRQTRSRLFALNFLLLIHITNIEVKLWYEEDGNPVERLVVVRLLSEDVKGNPVVRGKPSSVWRIVNWGLV